MRADVTLHAEEARQLLRDRLEQRGWSWKLKLYDRRIESIRLRPQVNAGISVVVISWRAHPDTIKCLEILAAQRTTGFELVFVDNGAPPGELDFALAHCNVYLRLSENTGAYLARNLGALFASAPILLFLDDDGLPAPDLIAAHLEAFRTYDCSCVRGVCLPKTDNPLNDLAKHYYLGNRPFPQYPVIEGNTSFAAELFYRVGGWDDDIRFGGGGFDLARRIVEIDPDMRRQIYHPCPAIRHDYVRDQAHLDAKTATQVASLQRLTAKLPDFRVWRNVWDKFRGREDFLLRRAEAPLPAERAHTVRRDDAGPPCAASLRSALARVGWLDKRDALAPRFERVAIREPVAAPEISVVIHAATGEGTGRCLRQLAGQPEARRQLICVQSAPDRGSLEQLAHTTVQVRPGTSVNAMRNLGAAFAEAPLLLFLEDREVPAAGLLAAHLDLHAGYDLLCVQGAIRPLTDSPLNREAGYFYPAARPFPLFGDADSNVSYRSETFYRAGGWPEDMGPEGAGFALARSIVTLDPDLRRQIYSPLPVIARDEASTASALDERRRGFAATRQLLRARIPDFERFLSCWDSCEGRDDLLPLRGRDGWETDARQAIAAYIAEADYFASVVRLRALIDDFPEQLFTTYQLGFWRTLSPPSREEIAARRAQPRPVSASLSSPARDDFAAAADQINQRLRTLPWFEPAKPEVCQLPLSIFCLKLYAQPAEVQSAL